MRIAIVDDDPCQMERLRQMLSEKLEALGDTGFRIRTFPSGEAFLENWTAAISAAAASSQSWRSCCAQSPFSAAAVKG